MTLQIGDTVERIAPDRTEVTEVGGRYIVEDVQSQGYYIKIEGVEKLYLSKKFKLVQSLPKGSRPFADIIKAWAEGYEVQYYDNQLKDWLDHDTPNFSCNYEWRVKPLDCLEERIESLEASIKKAQKQLEKMKNTVDI